MGISTHPGALRYTLIFLFTGFAVVTGITSCAQNEKSEETENETTSITSDLEGTWITSCVAKNKNYEVVVTGTTVTQKTRSYQSNSDCADNKKAFEEISTYSGYTVSDYELTFSPSGWKGRDYKIVVEKITGTPLTSSFASGLNSVSACGLNNWSVNIASEITGKTCVDSTYPVRNTTMYNTYAKDGGNAYIGTPSYSTYPKSVNNDVLFVKQ